MIAALRMLAVAIAWIAAAWVIAILLVVYGGGA